MEDVFPSESDLAAQAKEREKRHAAALEAQRQKQEKSATDAVKTAEKVKAMVAEFVRKAPSAGVSADEPRLGRPGGTWYRFNDLVPAGGLNGFDIHADDSTLWAVSRGPDPRMVSDAQMGNSEIAYQIEEALRSRLTGGAWK